MHPSVGLLRCSSSSASLHASLLLRASPGPRSRACRSIPLLTIGQNHEGCTKKHVHVFSSIIFNHSTLWPGQQGPVPFAFAAVVFSSLRVLTNMTLIAILSTKCFPVISVVGFHGLCGVVVISHSLEIHWNPPSVTAHCQDGAGARCVSEGLCSVEPGMLAKENRIRILPGLLPTRRRRRLFSLWSNPSPGSAVPCSWAALCRSHGSRVPSRVLTMPAGSGNPLRLLCRTGGCGVPRNGLFLRLFSLFPPESAAGEEADASWHGRSDFIPVAAVCAAVW